MPKSTTHPFSEVFWMVWNPSGRAPTHPHGSAIEAQREANRLAIDNPGSNFYVLMAEEVFSMPKPMATATKLSHPIPF